MEKIRKKELLREYRERAPCTGICAVVCNATGQKWISATKNFDKQQNRVWVQLRMGNHPNISLQRAWNQNGAETFEYRIIENVTDDNKLLIDMLLKEREEFWRREFSAEKLFG